MNTRNSQIKGSTFNQISQLVEEQCQQIEEWNNSKFDEDKIPLGIQELINQTVHKAFNDKVNRVTKDILITRIYELEIAWKIQRLKDVARFIGDIPKYSVGTEINKKLDTQESLVSQGGVSLTNLIDDIYKLPVIVRRATIETTNDAEDNEHHLLEEYNNVRTSLIKQCILIEVNEEKLKNTKDISNKVKSLESAIKETYGRDCDLKEYLPKFFQTLHESLDEMRDSLEQLVKSTNTSPEKRQHIEKILAEFNNQ
ncbi:similar to Saccharomyces cerevisiae YDR383C NKP1 Non-essential kinetochore protein [Maudiozyma barnettii]|mgnify:CR=1 FL=1|uniref:Similar to Saccharomyces cerevisiae YDR383C NKP1 Non-essential kinetochore protein n=1 Tax=Maudiozyma barnettii TaxID=61262 RepID=A0A8H2VEP1_9SACH|nr:Nkp1p [Kazachstania barnettii]CAB4253738.1 similar to Saccharomyces cerevisiae YDR383C NKP1 Non-essential kinetochore protein [Kazachstania barnettii]CAD1781486.1 similar to Saccharomyces cerevisiae YDR383C NKP1 Non-essential kinetochore protein [Kazachstania barnettii]